MLLIDGNIGLGADPERLLLRSRNLLTDGGRCIVEFDARTHVATTTRVRLESGGEVGPWFQWSTVGIGGAEELALRCGLQLDAVQIIVDRAVACLTRTPIRPAHVGDIEGTDE